MSWRDDLRRVKLADGRILIGASFRGAPFLVESTDRAGGRRAVVHEFPGRDDPYVEDLGRRPRSFQVEGYVVGAEYLAARNLLMAALEDQGGPGELVHPYHGVRRAVCNGMSVRESRADGGTAIFALEFIEAPPAPAPSDVVDVAGAVTVSAGAALAATSAELFGVRALTAGGVGASLQARPAYDTEGMPAFALASAQVAVETLSAHLFETLAPVVQGTQELALLQSRLQLLTSTSAALVREPEALLAALVEAVGGLAETALAAPGALVDALVETYGADLGPAAPETTATRQRERANQIALTAALRRILAIEAARLLPTVVFASLDEATLSRDRVAAMLEEQAYGASDEAYPALVTLRAALLAAVPSDATRARGLVTVERRVAVPSLLLSYQLYGDVTMEQDIIARNPVRHPGFLSGVLKVLSRGE